MARKRDYIQEILEKRSRTFRRTTRHEQFHKRYSLVMDSFEFLRSEKQIDRDIRVELLKYISIGSVACIEGYFRASIRDLIDYGSPFIDNVKELENIKLDIETIIGLNREKISVGEFISHLPSVSNLEDINRTMSKIIGEDFLNLVKKIEYDEFEPLEDIAKLLTEDIQSVFRSRHIYCHEIAVKAKPILQQSDDHIGATLTFVETTEAVLQKLMPSGKTDRR